MKVNIKQYFKKYINFEEILVCFISSVGYGFGYQIPDTLGAPVIVSLIICFVVGYLFDELARKIIDSNPFFDTTTRKIKLAIFSYLFYLAFWFIDYYLLGNDLDYDLFISLLILFIIPILGIIVTLIKQLIKKNLK